MQESTVEQTSFGEAQDGLKSEDDKTSIEVLEGESGDKGVAGLRQRARDSPSNTDRSQDSSDIEAW